MQIVIGTKKILNTFINQFDFEIKTNEYGKPFIINKELYFNKSHTKDLSVVVIDNKLCGIDMESTRKYNDLMAKKICSKEEYRYLNCSNNKDHDFTLFWVLKESYLKCIGVGLSQPLNEINLVENNKVQKKKEEFTFRIIHYGNYIISICRKD